MRHAPFAVAFGLLAAACAPKPRAPTNAAPLPPPAVTAFQVQAARALAEALEFEFEALAPIGPGFYATVRSPNTEGEAVVYLGPEPDGSGWTFGSDPPDDVLRAATLRRVAGVVRFDPKGAGVAGEVHLTIDTGGARLLPLQLDTAPESVLVETADGTPCPLKVIPPRDLVLVELPAAAEVAELRVRWRSRPPQIDHVHVRRDSLLLPGAYPWIPTLPATDAEFDLTLTYPRSFDLLPGGRAGRVTGSLDGWRSVRTRFRGKEPVTLVGRRSWVRRPLELDGVDVTIALPPSERARLPEVEASVRRAFGALAPLGTLPGRLAIAWCPQPAFQGIASPGFIGIDDFDPHVIAHELAHQYFQEIDDTPPPVKAWEVLPERRDWSGDWTEAVAEYLATWAKSDAEARAHRLGWSFRYAHARDLVPLREIRDKGLPSDDPRHVVVYTKGPLLLAEMERRLGRRRMTEALAAFIEEHRGRRADWADLADAFGEEHGTWLRGWLATPGAPRLFLADLRVADGHVEGVLRAEPGRFDGVLELGVVTTQEGVLLRMNQPPSRVHAVPFSGDRTAFRIPLPPDAVGLLLDPHHRLPRRWDGFEGVFVPLPVPED